MDQIIDSIDGQIIYQDHKFFELNEVTEIMKALKIPVLLPYYTSL